jgi:DNA-directed RNA polymerase specialized sigma subunit
MAKYDSLRKLDRNKRLKLFAEAHPEISYKEIGEMYGISESRAWRIIKETKETNSSK